MEYFDRRGQKNWFKFRINAVTRNWTFKAFTEKIQKIKKKVFAYGRYHIIKSINKTQIDEDLFEVDIEVDSLDVTDRGGSGFGSSD